MKNLLIKYILKRLSEASTIRGIVLSITSIIGYQLSDEQTNNMVWIVLGIIGLIGSFLPDSLKKEQNNIPKENNTNLNTKSETEFESETGWGDK